MPFADVTMCVSSVFENTCLVVHEDLIRADATSFASKMQLDSEGYALFKVFSYAPRSDGAILAYVTNERWTE
jgi:hypothetical protein